MLIEFDKIADYLGELYAAAQHDLKTADSGHVGLNGVSIISWREAYLEGCKDMAEGVITHVPEEQRGNARNAVLAAFEREKARLEAERVPA